MTRMERITVDPDHREGHPCRRGLRIRVRDVLDLLASGATHEGMLEDHPLLRADDIAASIEFAAKQSDHLVLVA